MMNSYRLIRWRIVAVLFFGCIVLLAMTAPYKPTLFCVEGEYGIGMPKYSLFNPFRSRAPERVAIGTIGEIKAYMTNGLIGNAELQKLLVDNGIFEKETRFPMIYYRLVEVQRSRSGYIFTFNVTRKCQDSSRTYNVPFYVTVGMTESGHGYRAIELGGVY